ncbi:MAG TPA: hypothetical protein VK277_05720 [Acidimicrobiales bacterium]|nr:hypothetical protein [Acidimicrobiales bacterium]
MDNYSLRPDRRRVAEITYSPQTPLEAAVLASESFQLGADSSGREVVCVGPRRLPKTVVPRKSEGLHGLLGVLGTDAEALQAFNVIEGDPWQISEAEVDESLVTPAAEEYLVMGLRPLLADGRPVRVAVAGSVVRLFILPWTIPAKTLSFGGATHFLVTATRGVVGDWTLVADGREGVIVGVAEAWVSVFERQQTPGTELVFRCDVPVPWIGDGTLVYAAPQAVGVFEARAEGGTEAAGDEGDDTISVDVEVAWVAKLPVAMTEGTVVTPVEVPRDVAVARVPDGPFEMEWQSTYPDLVASQTSAVATEESPAPPAEEAPADEPPAAAPEAAKDPAEEAPAERPATTRRQRTRR